MLYYRVQGKKKHINVSNFAYHGPLGNIKRDVAYIQSEGEQIKRRRSQCGSDGENDIVNARKVESLEEKLVNKISNRFTGSY